jgi:ubiquinone/menaquinone biosynthesis C-methylase UbiE
MKRIKNIFNAFIKYVGNNFGNPDGFGGIISTKIMNVINQRQYKTVLKNIQIEPNQNILDIGFGNGYLINKLLKQNIPINIYGIEISNDMTSKVKRKNKKYIDNGILKIFLEDISKTTFGNNLFNKICAINTIYFWHELDKCFYEIKRIIKPDGIFINVIYTKEYLDKIIYTKYGFNKYSIEEMENITKNNGMEIIKTIEIQKNKSYCIISKVKG